MNKLASTLGLASILLFACSQNGPTESTPNASVGESLGTIQPGEASSEAEALRMLSEPVKASTLKGRRIYLPTTKQVVEIGDFGSTSPERGDCTVDLVGIIKSIDTEVNSLIDIDVEVHFRLKYQGWGICLGRGNNCVFKASLSPVAPRSVITAANAKGQAIALAGAVRPAVLESISFSDVTTGRPQPKDCALTREDLAKQLNNTIAADPALGKLVASAQSAEKVVIVIEYTAGYACFGNGDACHVKVTISI